MTPTEALAKLRSFDFVGTIRDKDILSSVTVPQLHAFLRQRGWRPWNDEHPDIWEEVETLESGERLRTLVPNHDRYSDYAMRIHDILEQVMAETGGKEMRLIIELLETLV